jgi:predicted nuclease of predicted toxin-antitoxin system
MKILLDVHVPLAVAVQLRRRDVDAVSVAEWQDKKYREAPDRDILLAAHTDERILVTYDRKTIPKLLIAWSDIGLHHAGVILIDSQAIRPQDIGGLVRALRRFVEDHGEEDWTDRADYLRRA